jgi:hypothetical protein
LSYGDSNGAAHAARAAAALQFAPSGFYEILTGTDISRKAVLVSLTRTPLSAVEDLVSVDEGALFWLTDEVARRSINAGFTDGFGRDGYDVYGLGRDGIYKKTGTGRAARGFDRFGYDEDGFNRSGYGRNGFDVDGFNEKTGTRYDADGFDAAGIHKRTGTGYDEDGFDRDGLKGNSDRAGVASRVAPCRRHGRHERSQ